MPQCLYLSFLFKKLCVCVCMWYWRLNLVWWFARLVCLNFWFCVDGAVWEAWERWPQCERWPLAGGSLQGFIALSNFLLSLSASCRQTRIWPASFLLLPPCLPIALPSSLYGLALWNHKSKKLSSLHYYRLWCSIAGVDTAEGCILKLDPQSLSF